MKHSLYIALIVSLLFGKDSYAQQYDVVSNLTPFYCDGDSLKPIELRDSFAWDGRLNRGSHQVLCDSMGKPRLFTAVFQNERIAYHGLYDKSGKLLKQLSDVTANNSKNVRANSLTLIAGPDGNKCYLFVGGALMDQNSGHKKRQLSYYEIDLTGTDPIVSNEMILNARSCFYTTASYHTNTNDVWLITQSYDTLFSYLITSSGIGAVVTSPIVNYDKKKWSSKGMRFSLSGKSLLMSCVQWNQDSIRSGGQYLITLDFDQKTGKFTEKSTPIYIPNRNSLKLDGVQYYGQPNNVSYFGYSEDSIVACYIGTKPQVATLLLIDTKTSKISPITLNLPSSFKAERLFRYENFQFMNTGKQYLYARYNDYNQTYGVFMTIDDQIKNGKLNTQIQLISQDIANHLNYAPVRNTPQILYKPHSLSVTYKRLCDSSIQFIANADTTFFKSFKWEFADGEMLSGDNVSKKFNKEEVQRVKLIGTTAWGYSRWTADTFSVLANYFSPLASFDITDTVGCQWVAQKYLNNSIITYKGRSISQRWLFGDGTSHESNEKDSILLINPSKTYTSSGLYTVSLIVDDGYCIDTMTRQNSINILSAPKPELTLSSYAGCDPLTIEGTYLRADLIDSAKYEWDVNTKELIVAPSSNRFQSNHTYSGLDSDLVQQQIIQSLYGPTGCVTHDTAFVNVKKTFGKKASPYLNLVTVEENNYIKLNWEALDGVKDYRVIRNGTTIGSTNDLFYIDSTASISEVNIYNIWAVNHCDGLSQPSNIGKNIVLSGYSNNNEYAYLSWTPYEQWTDPIDGYEVYAWDALKQEEILPIAFQTDLNYKDNHFVKILENPHLGASKCYKVKTTNSKTNATSISNTLCLNYSPTTYIPTAFTPNEDKLNDKFNIVGIAIKSYFLTIYNGYGEKIFENSSPTWDGMYLDSPAPAGMYMYTLKVVTFQNQHNYLTGTIQLIR
jgi:gliding motility-associated-like protein|tara:strand:- start:2778 stop:5636 length:2859 start_codon:yes stop_codon:yes gene_type:complete